MDPILGIDVRRRKLTLARKFEAVKRKIVVERSRIPSVRRAGPSRYEFLFIVEHVLEFDKVSLIRFSLASSSLTQPSTVLK